MAWKENMMAGFTKIDYGETYMIRNSTAAADICYDVYTKELSLCPYLNYTDKFIPVQRNGSVWFKHAKTNLYLAMIPTGNNTYSIGLQIESRVEPKYLGWSIVDTMGGLTLKNEGCSLWLGYEKGKFLPISNVTNSNSGDTRIKWGLYKKR
jgi:hypothetical protein